MSYEELFAEYQRLKSENAQLRAQLEDLKQRLLQAERQIAELRRQLFGPKADKLTAEQEEQLQQLTRDLEAEARRPRPASDQVLQPGKGELRRRRVRHPLPAEMETETIILEPETKVCSHCGRLLERIGEEVSEEIDLVPAKLIRRKTIRPKYACRCGQAGVEIAPLPPRLIPQSRLGLRLATHILLSHYEDHQSFYGLEQQFRHRYGTPIPRQQMVEWVEQIASWLLPIYDAMWQRMLTSGYLQIDETPVRVMDPDVRGKTARGYLWFYAVPGGDVILDFDRSRALKVVQQRLHNFTGTIQTDAYEVYQSLQRKQPHISRIGCLAHARRRFYAALQQNLAEAVWFISHIRQLYQIEEEVRNLDAAQRQAIRQEKAPPIWETMKAKALELQSKFLPKSTMGSALRYFLEEYDALIGYLRDGRFEIDNNLIENSIRPTAIGRKRWLFIGHPDAGWRSAVIYSILISCHRRGINTQDYLNDVLRRLPEITINRIQELLPANWKPTNPTPG